MYVHKQVYVTIFNVGEGRDNQVHMYCVSERPPKLEIVTLKGYVYVS